MTRTLLLLLLSCAPGVAWAARPSIGGTVVDRNGDPVGRAVVSLAPGGVQIVTDAEGRYSLDYLRDDDGGRTRLKKKVEYALEIFKPGFHVTERTFYYQRGTAVVEPIVLVEDAVTVADDRARLDPTLYGIPGTSDGAAYEGQ